MAVFRGLPVPTSVCEELGMHHPNLTTQNKKLKVTDFFLDSPTDWD